MEIKIGTKGVTITSVQKLSNRYWHSAGKPKWWAKVKNTEDDRGEFLSIGFHRGDMPLVTTIPLDEVSGKFVQIGVGKLPDGIREMEYIPEPSS